MGLEQIVGQQIIDQSNQQKLNTTNTAYKLNNTYLNNTHEPPTPRPSKFKTAVAGIAIAAYLFLAGFVGPGCTTGPGSSVIQSTGAGTQTVPAPNPPSRIDRLDTDLNELNDQKIKVGIVAPAVHPEYNSSYQLELYEKDGSGNYVLRSTTPIAINPTTVNNIQYAAVNEFTGLINGTQYKICAYALNSLGQPSTYAPPLSDQTALQSPKNTIKLMACVVNATGTALGSVLAAEKISKKQVNPYKHL